MSTNQVNGIFKNMGTDIIPKAVHTLECGWVKNMQWCESIKK